MSEHNEKHGKREAPGGEFPLVTWWKQHRAWVAGLDRGARIKYRIYLALVVVAVLIIALYLFLRSWIKLPEVPDLPGTNLPSPGNSSQVQTIQPGQSGELDGDISYDGAELPDVAKSGRKDGYYTFLLCGRDVVSGSTDTMILITYDTKGKTISAVSLLRDTMINTSAKGGGQKRLNTVFTRNSGNRSLSVAERIENGMTALRKEVSHLTGIYPDFYVQVEWEAIGRLVDAVGGVEFEIPYDMDYDDPAQELHIHQKKGLRVLNGDDAMQVVRFRKNNDRSISLGDIGRTELQRDFLIAVLKRCLTPEILLKLPTLVQIFKDNVNTDLSVGNILAFAQLAIGMDVETGVNFAAMPCYGVMYDKASLVCISQNEMLKLLNSGMNPYMNDIKSSDLRLMYKKSGGGFGVTNGTLLDPAVANPPPPSSDPKEPGDDDDDDGNPGVTNNPGTGAGTTTDPGTATDPGTTTVPGNTTDPGTTEDPGNSSDPPDIGTIDPSVVFPDPANSEP